MTVCIDLVQLEGDYAISLLAAKSAIPDWVAGEGFVNVSICDDELSIVSLSERVPPGTQSEAGWTAIRLNGSFDFDQTGIVLSVVKPISENGLGIFLVSTFHRDYLLVKTSSLDRAKQLLETHGHRFRCPAPR